ncbi:MAG: methyltransferase domain-containing protein [Planctomycetota bacterium]
MDRATFEALCWLELHFDPEARAEVGQAYAPYQPIDGVREGAWTPLLFLMVSRWARLLHHLRRIRPRSFLDVGGAEGFIAGLVQRVLGVPSVSLDLSTEAGCRAREFSGVPALGGEAHRLPFPDDAFDVILLCEVVEHLVHPIRSLLEAARVARRAVIVTSEAFVRSEEERQQAIRRRDAELFEPHMDRSILMPEDLEFVFDSWHVLASNQCAGIPEPMPQDRNGLQAALEELLASHGLEPPSHALFFLADRAEQHRYPDSEIAQDIAACLDRLRPVTRGRQRLSEDAALPRELEQRLVCPVSGELLARHGDRLVAGGSKRSYPIRCGVPSMLTEPGLGFDEPLEDRLLRQLRDRDRVARLLSVSKKLAFSLPEPVRDSVFFSGGTEAWRAGPGVTLATKEGGGILVSAEEDDPCLFSPRIDRPTRDVRGLTIEMSVQSPEPWEEVQVFYRTLLRPLWCEAASVSMRYETGRLQRIFLRFPPGARTLSERRRAPGDPRGSGAPCVALGDRPADHRSVSLTSLVRSRIMIFCQIFRDSPVVRFSISLTARSTVGSAKPSTWRLATLPISESISPQ